MAWISSPRTTSTAKTRSRSADQPRRGQCGLQAWGSGAHGHQRPGISGLRERARAGISERTARRIEKGESGKPNVLPIGGSRNSEEGDSFSKIDVRISQEVRGFAPGHRGSAFIVVDNLTNLLNDDWGVMNQPSFPYGVTAGQAANGQAQQRIGEPSLWSMRAGLNYRF